MKKFLLAMVLVLAMVVPAFAQDHSSELKPMAEPQMEFISESEMTGITPATLTKTRVVSVSMEPFYYCYWGMVGYPIISPGGPYGTYSSVGWSWYIKTAGVYTLKYGVYQKVDGVWIPATANSGATTMEWFYKKQNFNSGYYWGHLDGFYPDGVGTRKITCTITKPGVGVISTMTSYVDILP